MPMYYSPSTNGFYDSDLNYPSLPEDVVEISRSAYENLLHKHYKEGKEIYFDGTSPALRDVPVPAVTWNVIRSKRNKLLSKSDYTQMTDWPGDKASWATYRQALRDLPQTYANAVDVIWPTAPGA